MIVWNDGGDVVVTGSDTATKPGGLQYAQSGGNGPYTWTVSGTGAVISSSGYLTLGEAACGVVVVTCTDCTGRSDSINVRVTNNGSWGDSQVSSGYFYCDSMIPYPCYCDVFCGDWTPCTDYTSYDDIYKRTYTLCLGGCSARGPADGGCMECGSYISTKTNICNAAAMELSGQPSYGTYVPPGAWPHDSHVWNNVLAFATKYTWTC